MQEIPLGVVRVQQREPYLLERLRFDSTDCSAATTKCQVREQLPQWKFLPHCFLQFSSPQIQESEVQEVSFWLGVLLFACVELNLRLDQHRK